MTVLPDEIWSDILEYLGPEDLVTCQSLSRRLSKLARDTSLWRNKVFEKAPSATRFHASRPNAVSDLTGALGGLSLGGSSTQSLIAGRDDHVSTGTGVRSKASLRARAIREWDNTHADEKTDWYSEYIARHAPLSTTWAGGVTAYHEVRGMAMYGDVEKVVCTFDDGSLGIWDVQRSNSGRRRLSQVAKSRSGLLFEDVYSLGESSTNKSKALGTAVENISIDSKRRKAFVAVENTLNEVDLDRMEVISQNKFAWHITALSQESNVDNNLTVGTSFSLHIHDPRLPFLRPTDNTERLDDQKDSKIAFLQNWTKGLDMRVHDELGAEPAKYYDYGFTTNKIEAYARCEPGPQSILHRKEHEIVIAGRMPSILFYDRRLFPKPRTAIYSGARLSAMTTLAIPPAHADSGHSGDSTLIACGEYGGRGSLELYELPWDKRTSFSNFVSSPTRSESAFSANQPFSYRNRQEASSSKLLSVATQGTRIVFSDSEGMLKWVERDGHGLARRWNINTYQINERGASISGDKVVRKMIPFPEESSERGTRGDGDILVWTGENIGIVTTKPKPAEKHDDLVEAFERGMNLTDLDDDKRRSNDMEADYSTMMRQALERQADERRWMSRFGARRW